MSKPKPNRDQKRKLAQMVQRAQAQQADPQQQVITPDYLLQEIGGQHVELGVLRRQVQGLIRANQELREQREPESTEEEEEIPKDVAGEHIPEEVGG